MSDLTTEFSLLPFSLAFYSLCFDSDTSNFTSISIALIKLRLNSQTGTKPFEKQSLALAERES